MNDTKCAAEERLLDASLEVLLGHAVGARSATPARVRWWAAAVLLIGVGAVAATVWLRRADSGQVAPAQEPVQAAPAEPLPDEVPANGTAALLALPVDTVNLVARLGGPADLPLLRRFGKLRRLVLLRDVSAPPSNDPGFGEADAEALVPLGALQSLEQLELPWELTLHPELVVPLRELSKLRCLAFAGGRDGGAALGDALVTLPALRELRAMSTVVDAPFFRALANGRLQRLALWGCPGLDGDAWAAIGSLRTLRGLEVTAQNDECTVGVGGKSYQLHTLGEAAFAAFGSLPALRELALDESHFDDALLLELPQRLERLDLGDRPMGSLAARALQRLAGLRDLTFGCGLEPEPAIRLLGVLRLERLDYRGRELPDELLRAIAAQPQLVQLALRVREGIGSLGPLAVAPRLTQLEVRGNAGLSSLRERTAPVDVLKPLRDSSSLRRVRLVNCGFDMAAVRELLGAAIAVDAVEYL